MFYVLTVIGLSVFANDCIDGLLCSSCKVIVLLLFFVFLSKAFIVVVEDLFIFEAVQLLSKE